MYLRELGRSTESSVKLSRIRQSEQEAWLVAAGVARQRLVIKRSAPRNAALMRELLGVRIAEFVAHESHVVDFNGFRQWPGVQELVDHVFAAVDIEGSTTGQQQDKQQEIFHFDSLNSAVNRRRIRPTNGVNELSAVGRYDYVGSGISLSKARSP